ncbi:MAG TPA: hypothetical protein QGG59_00205 [Planctomycetota bacterium]|jgi:hypothetical protein|nr:hypothetical protein [Planctomycetota bacterium]MDP7559241.1 hypothetical protein [Planctomycetota bacterium]HJM38517.1 hypothetical protein [Planctomycetota bacterium]|tara:strand:+ start:56037 stop:56522 length:486 start_codon:yes stop_codon:yes gene_type:complete
MTHSQLPEDLQAFADELRLAHPNEGLSPDFSSRLLREQVPVWSFSSALRQNRLVRMAAGFLVLLTASVPVLAVLSLVIEPEITVPAIGFDLPYSIQNIETEDIPVVETIPPYVPPLAELLDESWRAEVEKQNEAQSSALEFERFMALPAYFVPGLGWICRQ